MSLEDVKWEKDGEGTEKILTDFEKWAQRRMRNVAKPFKTHKDTNAALQASDPNWYGPYLQEGEKYEKERTVENVRKAAE